MRTAITCQDLTRRFGDFVAVDQVTFEVSYGEIFGYLGANGAGKSTTIRMLCGLLSPSDGRAEVAGFDVATASEKVKQNIGYMSQKFSLYPDLTVAANLEFFGSAYGLSGKRLQERMSQASEAAQLDELGSELTSELPGGVKQRVALAASVLHDPKIVFLDEPTAGVDPVSRRAFWHLIRALADSGKSVFVTTHHMDEAEYCRRVGLMVDGRLVALDSPRRLKDDIVPGRTYEISGARLPEAVEQLRGVEGVHAVTRFGSAYRARVDPERLGKDDLLRALRSAGGESVAVHAAEASLEDVFLRVVGADREEVRS